jgi:hypothetical protein
MGACAGKPKKQEPVKQEQQPPQEEKIISSSKKKILTETEYIFHHIELKRSGPK